MSYFPQLLNKFKPQSWNVFYLSEKFDGWRMLYLPSSKCTKANGMFITRQGNEIILPKNFYEEAKVICEDNILDGELFGKYGDNISLKNLNISTTDAIDTTDTFRVFDIPTFAGNFKDRYSYLEQLFQKHVSKSLIMVHQELYVNSSNMESTSRAQMEKIIATGGEGVVIRNPFAMYNWGSRNDNIMKLKPNEDTELIVTGYHSTEKTKHLFTSTGYVSSLICKTPEGCEVKITFKRTNPPPIFSIINIRHSQWTVNNLPKFPVYVGIRDPSTLEKDIFDSFNRISKYSLTSTKEYELPKEVPKEVLKEIKPKEESVPKEGSVPKEESVPKEQKCKIMISKESMIKLNKFFSKKIPIVPAHPTIIKETEEVPEVSEVQSIPNLTHKNPEKLQSGQITFIKKGEKVVVGSKSNYNVIRSKDGSTVYCTCEAWKYQRLPPKDRVCKHMLELFAKDNIIYIDMITKKIIQPI